ncbi:proline dipeptidase, partial [mine drainage metagenome]
IFRNAGGVEKILIRNGGEGATDKAYTYLSGTVGGLFENSSIVASKDSITLYVYSLEEQTARATGQNVVVAHSAQEMKDNLQGGLRGEKKIGLNFDSMIVNLYKERKSSSREWNSLMYPVTSWRQG